MTSLFGENRGGTPTDEPPRWAAPHPTVRWLCPRLSASCFLFLFRWNWNWNRKWRRRHKPLRNRGPTPWAFSQASRTSHFTWQVLRTVKRSKKPLAGRALRLVPNRYTKDGSFLTALVDQGLLTRSTGTATAPFEATYALTEKGKNAAEFGEYEYELKSAPVEAQTTTNMKTSRSRKAR